MTRQSNTNTNTNNIENDKKEENLESIKSEFLQSIMSSLLSYKSHSVTLKSQENSVLDSIN